jgi:hypothetical protein
MQPGASEDDAEPIPSLCLLGSAFDDDVINEPAFETSPPGPDVNLDAILLNVGACGQEQAASGDGADL